MGPRLNLCCCSCARCGRIHNDLVVIVVIAVDDTGGDWSVNCIRKAILIQIEPWEQERMDTRRGNSEESVYVFVFFCVFRRGFDMCVRVLSSLVVRA